MRDYFHLWQSALFFKREAYEYQRDRKDSFAHGLTFIVVLGVLVGLFGIAGAALRYATEPSADAVKNTVLNHLQAMPFYSQFTHDSERQFLSGYNQVWQAIGSLFMGYPTNFTSLLILLAGVVTTPLSWIVGWLVYGLLAHLIAGRGNPQASLAHGLGTLALATAPQALNIVTILPAGAISGPIIGLWTMIANVLALRAAYRISTRRAIGAAIFPLLLLLILLAIFACIGFFALISYLQGVRR